VEGDAPSRTPTFVIVGRVRRAHGMRGGLAVELLTDSPDVVFAAGRRVIGGTTKGDVSPNRAELHVRSASPFKDGLLVEFAELSDRESAERWRDRFLLLPGEEIPPAAPDEVYLHELVGLRVRTVTGEELGVVESFYDLPQGLTLEVRRGEGTFLLPYREEFVRQADSVERLLTVELPAGFFD
jgi:16S rRNA processing protein RimM